jgi:hypothetical protein
MRRLKMGRREGGCQNLVLRTTNSLWCAVSQSYEADWWGSWCPAAGVGAELLVGELVLEELGSHTPLLQ